MRFKRFLLSGFVAIFIFVAVLFVSMASSQETVELSNDVRQQASGSFIPLSEGLTHYFHAESDSSTLMLFIHGGGVTGMEVWSENISFFLDRSYEVLAYDLYGRGYSDRPHVVYSPELLTDQLCGLLDSLNIRKPLNIVAMSMGAMVALDYTDRYPDRVNKIVLIDPAITGDFKPNFLLKVPVVSSLLMTTYWYPNAVENQRKEFVDQALFDQYQKRLKYFMNFSGYKRVNYSTWMHTLGESNIRVLDSLKPNSLLLIYGDQDPYFPEGNVALFAKHYPTLQVKQVENAGHMPHFERPGEVNSQIQFFFLDSSTNPI